MKFVLIIAALAITLLTPVPHIKNSTTEQHHDEVVVTEPITEQVEVANQTPVETVTTVVEQVQEQTPNQAEANVVLNPVGCSNYRYLVEQYDWNVSIAMAIMQAESGCNPEASNWSDNHRTCIGSFGLFQLACFWTGAPFDPATNVAKAYEIYSRSGWVPWGAYTNGSYLRYL